MLTVILGAGASYDSVSSHVPESATSSAPIRIPRDESARPPLAQELFDDRFRSHLGRFPACTPLVGRLRQATDNGEQLETVLGRFQSGAVDYPRRKNQMMAIRYYLQEVISDTCAAWYGQSNGVTNYAVLVDRLNEWSVQNRLEVGYVTFNYDYLLEQALRSIGRRFGNIDDYISLGAGPMTRVVKPHGSCDWMRIATRPVDQNTSWSTSGTRFRDATSNIEMTEQILETNEIWAASDLRPFERGEIGVPAIAIPTDDKQEFVCPQSHIEALQEMLRATDTVLVIGWRASEPHFLAELREHIRPGVRCYVANGSDVGGGLAMNQLQAAGVNQFVYPPIGGPGFSDLVETDALQVVLDRAARPS